MKICVAYNGINLCESADAISIWISNDIPVIMSETSNSLSFCPRKPCASNASIATFKWSRCTERWTRVWIGKLAKYGDYQMMTMQGSIYAYAFMRPETHNSWTFYSHPSFFCTCLNFMAVRYAEKRTELNRVKDLKSKTMSGWSQCVVSVWWLKKCNK